MLVERENKIGEVVAMNFETARIFEDLGLDFCCGGKKTIEAACNEKGIDPVTVLDRLEKVEDSNATASHFSKWDVDFLSDYIINNHHSYVQNSIPGIERHLEKVVNAHGERNPELKKVQEVFFSLKEDLLSHMLKEEKMLFPYIKKLNFANKHSMEVTSPPFGSVDNPIKVMEDEHRNAGNELEQIGKLTNNFTPPENACGTFKVLYSELKDFEKDLHIHIHLENNILFPKAAELEKKLIKLQVNSCSL
jgi:regulator of cell morphogenesis and NO signaling